MTDGKEWEMLGQAVAIVASMDVEHRFMLAPLIRKTIREVAGKRSAELFVEGFQKWMVDFAEQCMKK